MGDISRHRDIYFNTQAAIPASLLDKCKLAAADLTYLELGNYLTDVSQFRDPVTYIFAKQRIWREFIIPKAKDKVGLYRGLAALAAYVSLAASQTVMELTSGVTSEIAKYAGPALAGVGAILAALPTDTYAELGGADDWIDQMFGTPIERTIGDPKKRDEKKESSLFDKASDNGAFNEIIGSHSLMPKDTPTSSPFYDDAKVLASVASMSVFRIMLEQISAPAGERKLPWQLILQHFIRFPVVAGGWERRAIAFFRENNGRIPRYEDLPELARLVELALRSSAARASWEKGTKDAELQERYIKLEREVSLSIVRPESPTPADLV